MEEDRSRARRPIYPQAYRLRLAYFTGGDTCVERTLVSLLLNSYRKSHSLGTASPAARGGVKVHFSDAARARFAK